MTSPDPTRTTTEPSGGGIEAFHLSLVRELPRLRKFAARRYGVTHAEDVVQDTLLRALQHGSTHDRGRAVWPWLKAIAANASSRRFEREARAGSQSIRDDALASTDPRSTVEQAGDVEDRARLHAMLDRLREHERSAVDGHYLRGLSVAEVAAEQAVPVGTVKARLSRARRRLALVAGSLSMVLIAGLFVRGTQGTTQRGRGVSTDPAPQLHEGSMVIERVPPPEPLIRRVNRSAPVPTGWVIKGAEPVTRVGKNTRGGASALSTTEASLDAESSSLSPNSNEQR